MPIVGANDRGRIDVGHMAALRLERRRQQLRRKAFASSHHRVAHARREMAKHGDGATDRFVFARRLVDDRQQLRQPAALQ